MSLSARPFLSRYATNTVLPDNIASGFPTASVCLNRLSLSHAPYSTSSNQIRLHRRSPADDQGVPLTVSWLFFNSSPNPPDPPLLSPSVHELCFVGLRSRSKEAICDNTHSARLRDTCAKRFTGSCTDPSKRHLLGCCAHIIPSLIVLSPPHRVIASTSLTQLPSPLIRSNGVVFWPQIWGRQEEGPVCIIDCNSPWHTTNRHYSSRQKQSGKGALEQWRRQEQSQQNEQLRPITSYSTKGPNNWRETFRGFGANSSMVDLSASMRKQSIGNLRSAPSESNLRGQWSNASSSHLALPTALGGSGARVGTPERPSTSSGRTKEWVNPLDVHFAKDTSNSLSLSLSGPQTVAPGPKSPLALEINADEVSDPKRDSDNASSTRGTKTNDKYHPTSHNTGYPSPPQSINNGDQALSPVTPDLSNTTSRTGLAGGASSLPSPATSASRTSEERFDAPVIRNVLAKRDTTTFHSPRRRSFTKDVEVEELERLRKQQQTEGFAGNFSEFNFGETVTRQQSNEPQPERGTSSDTVELERADRKAQPSQEPAISRHIAPFLGDEELDVRKPTEQRFSGLQTKFFSKRESSIHITAGVFEVPPPAPVEKPAAVPCRPVTSYGGVRNGAPAAAAGAHPGNGVESFDPPPAPLGFRARLGSDASSRRKTGPPRPLRPAAELVPKETEPSIKSPAERAPSEKSLPTSEAPKASLDTSPISAYNKPMEGDFPVTKGLPRGRQPPRRPPRSDEAFTPEQPEFATPNWNCFNRAEPRHSAIPPPLSPAKQGQPFAPSTLAPQLPSPSFASFSALELSISNSGDSLAKAFEEALGQSSLDDGFVDDFFTSDNQLKKQTTNSSATRVEAKKAPPRPPPITLPPSPAKSTGPATRSPVPTPSEFQPSFF